MIKDKANKPQKKDKLDDTIAELTEDLQRIQADFINFKRRSDEDRQLYLQMGKEQAISSLLPVLDNIDRAIAHEPDDIKEHQWVKGITSIANQLEAQLENIGLIKLGQKGEPFDPNLHEAVAMDETDGDTEVIDEVIQTGYQFGDTIIRPAMVKVTRN